MAWSVPSTVVTGDIITAAWGNTYVRDNPAYLMSLLDGTGGAITVTVPDRLQVSNDTNLALYKLAGGPIFVFDGNDYIYYDRTSNYWQFVIGGLQKYVFDSNGKITGAGFYSSGEVAVINATLSSSTHGLGARPRFVAVYWSNVSSAESAKANVAGFYTGTGAMAAGEVGITVVSSTIVTLYNKTGATAYCHTYAFL